MVKKKPQKIECHPVELDGIRYVILRESAYEHLCRLAHVDDAALAEDESLLSPDIGTDRATLAKKLVRRRQSAGLSQVELARRAGIRQETLNRIERGRTTPDFATIRKLVVAMNAAEQQHLSLNISTSSDKEK
jgi:ribosome-binding protein aMBF1 (putative translation factor)